jgi:hypothetical protein
MEQIFDTAFSSALAIGGDKLAKNLSQYKAYFNLGPMT